MNQSNVPAILRSLITYAICVPLAIFIGWSLANPMDMNTLGFYGVFGAILVSPILLRWHMELLTFSWWASLSVFILPGSPNLWLVMVVVSLTISVLERILSNQRQFIRVPELTWPLVAFLAVVLVTAELTGGVGLRAFGSSVYGGKKYVYLFISVLSFFAITARPIPRDKAWFFIGLYFVGKITGFIGNLFPIAPSWMHPLFLIFPPTVGEEGQPFELGVTRLGGFADAACFTCYWMLAMYGLRGILTSLPRLLLLMVMFVMIFLGGFRSALASIMVVMAMMFLWEGLQRTYLLMVFLLLTALTATALVPLAHHLPFTFQRTLAFLPLDLDQEAVQNADASTEFRRRIWEAFLPQIPEHLLLGKGLAISVEDLNEVIIGNDDLSKNSDKLDASQGTFALANDFHNGMLSLVVPFGAWGVITVLWFLWAGAGILYRNAKYGDPEFRHVNAVLFFLFAWEAVNFVSCVGGLQIASELANFIGYLGMSIALNNGVCQPAPDPRPQVVSFRNLPRPRPVFQT